MQIESYKSHIRQHHKSFQKKKPVMTLKKLANLVPLQYTYLSKVLNQDGSHIGEDHLFRICRLLELSHEETDYILLLRAYEMATDPARQDYLRAKIQQAKKVQKLQVEEREAADLRMTEETRYLVDPLAVLVHAALDIKDIRRDPRALCRLLGISADRLKEILATLDKLAFIKIEDRDPWTIKEYFNPQLHFGKQHPLMRVHQNLLKTQITSHLTKVDEANKHSFLATFSADHAVFAEIQTEFQNFLSKCQKIAQKSRHTNLYQMSFDLFRWI